MAHVLCRTAVGNQFCMGYRNQYYGQMHPYLFQFAIKWPFPVKSLPISGLDSFGTGFHSTKILHAN